MLIDMCVRLCKFKNKLFLPFFFLILSSLHEKTARHALQNLTVQDVDGEHAALSESQV